MRRLAWLLVLTLGLGSYGFNQSAPAPQSYQQHQTQTTQQDQQNANQHLSNDNYYTNSNGNQVFTPLRTRIAECRGELLRDAVMEHTALANIDKVLVLTTGV